MLSNDIPLSQLKFLIITPSKYAISLFTLQVNSQFVIRNKFVVNKCFKRSILLYECVPQLRYTNSPITRFEYQVRPSLLHLENVTFRLTSVFKLSISKFLTPPCLMFPFTTNLQKVYLTLKLTSNACT